MCRGIGVPSGPASPSRSDSSRAAWYGASDHGNPGSTPNASIPQRHRRHPARRTRPPLPSRTDLAGGRPGIEQDQLGHPRTQGQKRHLRPAPPPGGCTTRRRRTDAASCPPSKPAPAQQRTRTSHHLLPDGRRRPGEAPPRPALRTDDIDLAPVTWCEAYSHTASDSARCALRAARCAGSWSWRARREREASVAHRVATATCPAGCPHRHCTGFIYGVRLLGVVSAPVRDLSYACADTPEDGYASPGADGRFRLAGPNGVDVVAGRMVELPEFQLGRRGEEGSAREVLRCFDPGRAGLPATSLPKA